jgi:hypothetical protein
MDDTVEFGTIIKGEARQKGVEIQNHGESTIIITSLLLKSIEGLLDGFTLNAGNVSFPVTLQPGESITLLVDFGGDTPGEYGGVIVMPDGCGNPVEIQLRGRVDDDTEVREHVSPPDRLDLTNRAR